MSDAFEKVEVGDEQSFEVADVNRTHFVRYAGGGGDFNPKAFVDMSDFLGADRILAKPFSSEEFLSAVNDCLA